ncbi:MAG: protoporphyrinogen oxidase HemJ [Pseudomonadota bacterium]
MMTFLTMLYPWIKSFHMIAVIAWMAGMMYLPRLFVYHHQAETGGEAAKFFTLMEGRLLRFIINPSMMATWILGILLIVVQPVWAGQPWFWVKFVAVLGISAVHGLYSKATKQFAAGQKPRTEAFWRKMNEVPFVLLILIVIMVIVKPFA